MNRDVERAGWIVLLIWCLVLLFNLAFWSGIIYIVLHFLSKVW